MISSVNAVLSKLLERSYLNSQINRCQKCMVHVDHQSLVFLLSVYPIRMLHANDTRPVLTIFELTAELDKLEVLELATGH